MSFHFNFNASRKNGLCFAVFSGMYRVNYSRINEINKSHSRFDCQTEYGNRKGCVNIIKNKGPPNDTYIISIIELSRDWTKGQLDLKSWRSNYRLPRERFPIGDYFERLYSMRFELYISMFVDLHLGFKKYLMGGIMV